MNVTYPPDGYGIDAYRYTDPFFLLRKQKHAQAVDLFCGYIHCRAFASMTRKSIVAPDPRRVQMTRYESECRGPSTPIEIPDLTDRPSSTGKENVSRSSFLEARQALSEYSHRSLFAITQS